MMIVVFLILCLTAVILICAWVVYIHGPPDTDDQLEQAHKKLISQWGTPIEPAPRYQPSPLEVAQSVHHSFAHDWTTAEQELFLAELFRDKAMSDTFKVHIIHHELRRVGYEISPNQPKSLDKDI